MTSANPLPSDANEDAGLPCDRSLPPPVLLPADVAALLDLPSPRAAREFVARHGVPYIRLGGRVYVRLESLLGFLEAREENPPSEAAARERAAEDLRRIAPSQRAKQARRRQARRKAGSP